MRLVRSVASAIVWLLAAAGAFSVLLWGGARTGLVQPLVVVSGSMEPEIRTGDLLIDLPRDTSDLAVGDVVSVRSAVTEMLVTHRVVAVDEISAERWEVRLQGDANDTVDAEVYALGPQVLRPAVRVPQAGFLVSRLTQPAVAVPLLVALAALLGLSLMQGGEPGDARRRVDADDEPAPTSDPSDRPGSEVTR